MFKSAIQFSDVPESIIVGKGTYAEVYKLIFDSSEVACKITSKDEDDVHHPATLREISLLSVLQKINHPNIISIYGLEINHCDSILIYMPLYETNLRNFLIQRKKFKSCWIIEGIVKGLQFLHSINICHRDLKTENILLSIADKNIKLCDFGLCRFSTNSESTLKIVSPPYRPPEILINKNIGCVDMYKIDVWSLGCIIYEIFNRTYLFTPYKSDNRQLKKNKRSH